MKHAKNLTRIARNSVSSLATEVRSRINEKTSRLAPKPGAPRPVRPGIRDLDATGVLTVQDHGTDIPLHWYEVGPSHDAAAEAGGAEPLTVVFIHGFTLGADSWYRQFRGLRKELPGVRLLTLDLRGHGKTGAVPPSSCSTDTAAQDVLAVVAERAPAGKMILVGHSLGGQIAFAALRHAPEDVRQRIAGLMLVSTAIDCFAANGVPALLNLRIVGWLAGMLKASPKRVRRLRDKIAGLIAPALAIAVFSRPTNRRVIDLHAYMINETPLDTYLGFLDDLRGHDEYDAVPYLSGLPGVVLVGDNDDVTSREQAEKIIAAWPGAELIEVTNAGHMLPLEAPKEVNASIARLAEKVAGGTAHPRQR